MVHILSQQQSPPPTVLLSSDGGSLAEGDPTTRDLVLTRYGASGPLDVAFQLTDAPRRQPPTRLPRWWWNHLILEALTKPSGTRFAPCLGKSHLSGGSHRWPRPECPTNSTTSSPTNRPPSSPSGPRAAGPGSGTAASCGSSGSSWPPAPAGRTSRRNSAAPAGRRTAGCGPGRRPASGIASTPTCSAC